MLEAYLKGKLNSTQMLEVERIVALYPEVKQHFEGLKESLNLSIKEADDSSLDEILLQISEEEKEAFIRAMEEPEETRIKRINIIPRWSIVATLFCLISIMFNVFFFGQLSRSQKQLRELKAKNSQLSTDLLSIQQQLDYTEAKISHFLNKDNVHVRMESAEASQEVFANVFWNKKTHGLFISADQLPQPPEGHQYHLWAIRNQQQAIDAGVFQNKQIQELKPIEGDIEAFSVTLEKAGSTPAAMANQAYVKGFIKKANR